MYNSCNITYYVKQISCAHYHYLFYGIFLHAITIIQLIPWSLLMVTSTWFIYFMRWRINNLLLQPPSYMLTQSNQILCLVVLCSLLCKTSSQHNHNNYFFFRNCCSGKNNLIMTYCSIPWLLDVTGDIYENNSINLIGFHINVVENGNSFK